MKYEGKQFIGAIFLLAEVLSVTDLEALTVEITGGRKDGAMWMVEAAVQTVRGSTSSAQAVAVKVNGAPAAFNPADRTWQGEVTLSPGVNRLVAEALDAGGAAVDSGAADILYLSASQRLRGTLSGDTVLSAAAAGYLIDENIIVPKGATLRIESGVVIYLKSATSIKVLGGIAAEGTEALPIRFTRYGDGTKWKQILFVEAADSRFAHCIIEGADSAGEHQDYYLPGPRDYHEAVVFLATHVDFEGCVFRKLPDESAGAEGDALAIISDDPDHPGASSANIQSCKFLSIGQGVHTRYSYVLVEDCYFQGKRGDNDDVDLYGESTPPPLIRNNLFDLPVHEDRINPTKCSAVIIGNLIMGSDDQGLVLRDKSSPIVMNNIIHKVANGGIAVENSCTALLVNNTIFNCGTGLRLFDLGRWGSPYFLTPGGGTATVINCIIWNCARTISLADSSNTQIQDRGSHIMVTHSDVQGGRGGVSISGTQSTVVWGDGNLDADPLFVNAANADFHLLAGSPAVDRGSAEQAPADDRDGKPRPCGAGFDMGAYESGDCQPPQGTPFRRGDANADGGMDIADAVFILLHLFTGRGQLECDKSGDLDDGGGLEVADAIYLLNYLFLHGAAPESPAGACGQDPTPGQDPLTCESYPPCGTPQ